MILIILCRLCTHTKKVFIINLKFIWRLLFSEKDEKGRIDESITPYVVRHLSSKIDKSRQKLRSDKLTYPEFEKLVKAFGTDMRMKAMITISLESLSRPQELLGRKIKDVELFDNYAKIYITEHGKEGTGFLRIIDSYQYLSEWLNQHPQKDNPEAYLFITTGKTNRNKQMRPITANKYIKQRCKEIGLNKPITLYSLKRNGVTFLRLQGADDLEIQHRARWTSTDQLKTYDLSTQEDSFKVELIKRGLVEGKGKFKEFAPKTKECLFCNTTNGIAESICSQCKRPLDREVIEQEAKKKEVEVTDLKEQMKNIQQQFTDIIINKKYPSEEIMKNIKEREK